jgi:hypothetical protein
MNRALRLTKWLTPAAALFALACALLVPAEAGSVRRLKRARAQDTIREKIEKPDETPDDSTVRGRVVYDETSRPVRRARVMLITDGGGRREYGALTDARGDFRIKGVRPGGYYAFVDVPGVLSPVGFISIENMRGASSGMPDLGEGRKYFDRIEVDGRADVSVTVHARRGASISGRVSYADGDPAVNVGVTLMRRGPDGRPQKYLTGATMAALAGLRTDDRGAFRLTGLPPGEYLIGVSEAVNHGADAAGRDSMGEDVSGVLRGMFSQPLLMTFYPSATGLKEAGSVKVEAGEERADVDITIPERALRTISGVVRARRGGAPIRRAHVTITRRDDPPGPPSPIVAYFDSSEHGTNGTTTDEEGRWQLNEIPDGAYTIHVKPPEEYDEATAYLSNSNFSPPPVSAGAAMNMNGSDYRPPRSKRPYAPTRRDLEVSGGDVSEFVVEVADGARINGTVTIEGGGTPRYGYVALLRLGEGNGAPDSAGMGSGGGLEGGRFAVEGLPAGRFMLQPTANGADGPVYLKSVTWNGKDLLREPLELTDGASADGVRVVFGRNPATLNVTVRPADRRRAADVFISLVPADLSAWSPNARPTFCVTGDEGTCAVAAAPGEYRVVAMRRRGVPGNYEQEVRRRAAAAPRVTLRAGEPGRVEVDAPDN